MKLIVNGEVAQIPAGGGGAGASIPTGGIIMWSGTDVPDGWALCNGENGTPDLRGRFVLGASDTHAMGETGGSEEVTLTAEQMPKHTHSSLSFLTSGGGTLYGYANDASGSGHTKIIGHIRMNETGTSEPHNNMPPYYTLAYIMKL